MGAEDLEGERSEPGQRSDTAAMRRQFQFLW